MAHDIDLTSPQWTALVFEGKNKEYGAYEMRNDSSNRHLKALIIITILGLAAVYIPSLIKSEAPKDEGVAVSRTTEVDMSEFAKTENEIEKIEPVLPPVSLRQMDVFVSPIVVPDPEATERMMTQEALTESTGGIGAIAVTGVEGGTVEVFHEPIVAAAPPKEEIPVFVEQMPQFPGGDKEMMSWLSSHIQYPVIASEKGIQGRVVLRFVVRPDGSIDDVVVVKSLEPSCDKEAVRAVKSMPKWIPGRQNGNPVSVYYNIPVQFRLQVQ